MPRTHFLSNVIHLALSPSASWSCKFQSELEKLPQVIEPQTRASNLESQRSRNNSFRLCLPRREISSVQESNFRRGKGLIFLFLRVNFPGPWMCYAGLDVIFLFTAAGFMCLWSFLPSLYIIYESFSASFGG